MSYLIDPDYLPSIQSGNKAAMSQNNPAIQAKAEASAQAEAISFLKQKYDTTQEFTNTMVWSPTGPSDYPGRAALNAAAWASNTDYNVGAQVLHTGNVYQCITANNDASFISGNWLNLGPQNSIPYYATDRVYLNAATYSPISTYAEGDLTLTDGNVYQCNTTIPSPGEAWNPSHWTLLGAQFTIFYAALPKPLFNLAKGFYKAGDKVFWKNRIYTNIVPTAIPNHETTLQYRVKENLPYQNVFPDDPIDGPNHWGIGIPFILPHGTGILDTTYWTLGDNRDPQMVQKLVDITVYHLSRSISPRNIPNEIVKSYMGLDEHINPGVGGTIYPVYSALGWLQACARGEITPTLPVLQPPSGSRVRSGGPVKNVNSF